MNRSEQHSVWYAVRTFNCKEMDISEFLKEQAIPHFIPMVYAEKGKPDEKPHRVLVPVIHNMLFIKKQLSEKQLRETLSQCFIPLHIMKKVNSNDWYEIPDSQMTEFRLMCDPNYKGTRYISQQEAEAKIGKSIRIIHGPFKGIEGKLVRYGNDYYVVKTLVGIGVLLQLPRWYCKPL